MMLAAPVMVSRNTKLAEQTLRISAEVARSLNLAEGDMVVLSVGRIESPFKIRVAERAGSYLQLSPAALRRLHLPSARRYSLNAVESRLTVGPVVGIMHKAGSDPNRPFDAQTQFIKELYIEGTRLDELCFGFDARQINFANRTVVGYTWNRGRWQRGTFPIPDVIYPRDMACSAVNGNLRNRLLDLGCKFINPPLIGKWQTYRILYESADLTQYVPDTSRAGSFQQIDRMLRQYSSVYIKPINGSMGRNIIKVSRGRKAGSYHYQYKVNQKSYSRYASNRNVLRQNLRRIMRGHNYIVQQQINLLRVNGGIGDVRVMVQKDGDGDWSVTGKAFRIGPRGSITSNISGGGSGGNVDFILRRHFPDSVVRERIIREMDQLAVQVARALENETGAIGELGIDIGIDVNGKVWFIEANLKPARRVFILIGEPSTRRMSVRKPMLYARHLAGFSSGKVDA
ncbi:MAG: YheC/YheD family protein [Syntrophomonadaceae bacterium]|nr:YheC/YheD family protein [Syntrophomonadaceae bacterium]